MAAAQGRDCRLRDWHDSRRQHRLSDRLQCRDILLGRQSSSNLPDTQLTLSVLGFCGVDNLKVTPTYRSVYSTCTQKFPQCYEYFDSR